MKSRFARYWRASSIKKKTYLFIGVIMVSILTLTMLSFWSTHFSLVDFRAIMIGNSRSNELGDALDEEIARFEKYVKDPNEEKYEQLKKSIAKTERCVLQLPYRYDKDEKEIYRITWNIRNAYEVYVEHRDDIIRQGDTMQNYIAELYNVYDMQKYLHQYILNLNNENVYRGNQLYFSQYTRILIGSVVIIILILISLYLVFHFTGMMNRTLVNPITSLAEASREIAENNFYIDDIHIENTDELGDLIQSFNRMKDAMGHYAQAVAEKENAQKEIHLKELERVEMERQLEEARMAALVSQMNPHFLFNSLNVISGMANLENAEITEKMTKSLSNLLRYTVHNDLSVVLLKRELEIAREYTYLQHMRFGARIRFLIECRVNEEGYEIPPFTLQPLIENAVIHGISPKIEGGIIRVRICRHGGNLVILVADDGVGMSPETLQAVRAGMQGNTGDRIGIAFSNIERRFHALYESSRVEVFSKENSGTLVRITVAEKEASCIVF